MKQPVLSVKKALKKKVGTFYRPTKTTYRTGFCPEGEIEKKGYHRKSYVKNDGTKVKGAFVKRTCVPNTNKLGKTIPSLAKNLKVNVEELHKLGYYAHDQVDKRHKGLIKAIKKLSFATVNRMLVVMRTRQKAKESPKTIKLYNVYDTDIKWLKKYVADERVKSKNKNLFKNI